MCRFFENFKGWKDSKKKWFRLWPLGVHKNVQLKFKENTISSSQPLFSQKFQMSCLWFFKTIPRQNVRGFQMCKIFKDRFTNNPAMVFLWWENEPIISILNYSKYKQCALRWFRPYLIQTCFSIINLNFLFNNSIRNKTITLQLNPRNPLDIN